jgi:spheroidene monooxygenase
MVNQDPVSMAVSGVVVVLLVDFLRAHQGWGWMRLVQGSAALKDTPGLLFTKVMGSGHEGGFSLRPSATHQGLICVFQHADQADAFVNGPVVRGYQDRARSCFTSVLAVTSVRGEWDGKTWQTTSEHSLGHYAQQPAASSAIAAITRASIRPAKAVAFWRYAPAAQTDLQNAPGCQVAMGLGEAPLVRQCTFSVWRDTPSMVNYAHTGAHQQAIAAAYKNDFFSESMFVRMRVLRTQGEWLPEHSGEAAHG